MPKGHHSNKTRAVTTDHIVGLVYNCRISLFENFTGETKNVIKLFVSDRFFSKYKIECKKVCSSGG